MEFSNSYELLKYLDKFDLMKNKPKYWWPNAGTFEVVVGAILTQNSKWERVEEALENIREIGITPENIASLDYEYLASLIKPVGFYNQKSKRLIILSRNLLRYFGDFENFKENVTREWLLNQKGIGYESADSILCYGCFRDIMVVDSYTNRLLKRAGYQFDDYEELREWCERGILENWEKISDEYESLNHCYATFHGKIVEFMKKRLKKH